MQDPRAKPHLNPQLRGVTVLCIPFVIIFLNHVSTTVGSSRYKDWNQVRYSELQSLNASCYPRDSCRGNRTSDNSLAYNNCLCDKTCATYDACCLDSPYRFYRPIGRPTSKCVDVYWWRIYYGVFMVDQCRSDYDGDSSIRELCSGNAEELNDPMLLLHVTNTKTGITYKNYFCAACNDDVNRRHNVFWKIELFSWVKVISQSELINLKFDPYIKSWTLPNINGTEIDEIGVIVSDPYDVSKYVKFCPLYVTSGCPEGWSDDVIKRKCAAYTALVAVSSTLYRNIHCAMCNGITNTDRLKCSVKYDSGYISWGKPGLSFALLLDVNQSDGDRVGEVQKCSRNEIYDPFFNRCRVLKCALPGYVIKSGNCVKR